MSVSAFVMVSSLRACGLGSGGLNFDALSARISYHGGTIEHAARTS